MSQEPRWEIREAGMYDGRENALYTSQYAKVGELVDMWVDLIPGYATVADKFRASYRKQLDAVAMKDVQRQVDVLYATGYHAPYRRVDGIRRNEVTVMVYLATQGADLYVSWRAFIQGKISAIRVGIWLVVSAVLALPFSFSQENAWSQTEFDSELFGPALFWALVVTGVMGAIYGFLYRHGDFQALWREALNELQLDDVMSLSLAVHSSIVAAADTVGIMGVHLAPYEPLFRRRQPRF